MGVNDKLHIALPVGDGLGWEPGRADADRSSAETGHGWVWEVRMNVTFLVAVFSLVFSGASGFAEEVITYNQHVLPIFRSNCMQCHNPDKSQGGLDLSTFRGTMKGSSGGDVVVPGNAGGSPLFLVMDHQAQPYMPKNSAKRPAEEIETVRRWIEDGLLEHPGDTARKVNGPVFELALADSPQEKPEGLPPMPETGILEPFFRSARPNSVLALAASPWAPLVAVGGHKQLALFHGETFELLNILHFPEGVPHVMGFTGNASLLLAGGGMAGKSGRVVVWDVVRGNRVLEVGDEWDTILAADISGDQKYIALGGSSKHVKILATTSGETIHHIQKHNEWVTAIKFSPDAILLASGDRNGGLRVWETETGLEFHELRAHTRAITALAWRRDGNVLASASEDGQVRLWDMHQGNQVKNWQACGEGVLDIDYSRDGVIATVGRDRQARIWDANGNAQREFRDFADLPTQCILSHDGSRLFVGDWAGQVTVWSVVDGTRQGEFNANPPTLKERVETASTELDAALEEMRVQSIAKDRAEENRNSSASELVLLEEGKRGAEEKMVLSEEKLAESRQQHEQMSGEMSQLQEQLRSWEADNVDLEGVINTIELELERLHLKLDESKKQRDVLNQLLAESVRKIGDMEVVLGTLQVVMAEAETELNQARESSLIAQDAILAKRDALVRAEADILASGESLKVVEAEVERAKSEFKRWDDTNVKHLVNLQPQVQDWDPEAFFAQSVWPILSTRCVKCHGVDKEKSGLRLDHREGVLLGGSSGFPGIVPSDPDASEIFVRITLPEDDSDIMPPEEDPLNEEEIETVRAWIINGASFE